MKQEPPSDMLRMMISFRRLLILGMLLMVPELFTHFGYTRQACLMTVRNCSG